MFEYVNVFVNSFVCEFFRSFVHLFFFICLVLHGTYNAIVFAIVIVPRP